MVVDLNVRINYYIGICFYKLQPGEFLPACEAKMKSRKIVRAIRRTNVSVCII